MKSDNKINICLILTFILLFAVVSITGCSEKNTEADSDADLTSDEVISEDLNTEVQTTEIPEDIDSSEELVVSSDEEISTEDVASEQEESFEAESEEVAEENLTTENDTEESSLTAQNYKIISLKDLKPYPSDLTIKVGTTVEWRNINDNFKHVIGWKDQKQMGVTPEPILQGESWSYTFNEPGNIRWFSTARATVQGTIIIEE